jgi:hypothetical protein
MTTTDTSDRLLTEVERQQKYLNRQVEDRMEIDFILGQARSLVARSLRLIHLNDEPVEFVASAAHLSRFALNRQVKAFLSAWLLAA